MPLDDDWLDEQLLASDESERNWARRALGGMSVADAMAGAPRFGQILTRVPIELWRGWKKHCDNSGKTQAQWMREAVALKLAAEGQTELAQRWHDS